MLHEITDNCEKLSQDLVSVQTTQSVRLKKNVIPSNGLDYLLEENVISSNGSTICSKYLLDALLFETNSTRSVFRRTCEKM